MCAGSTEVTEHSGGALPEPLLEFVERSPAAVAGHDRDAWCALFARAYSIEDPVGSAPQKPAYPEDRGPLRRFFDTFIEPNEIRFLPRRDYVEGMQVLRDIEIEISRLGPLSPVRAEDVVPGRHGVLVRRGRRRGVLLPQVAARHGWDRETFLEEVCHKAFLPPDAWRFTDTVIEVFEAEVFGDDTPAAGPDP